MQKLREQEHKLKKKNNATKHRQVKFKGAIINNKK